MTDGYGDAEMGQRLEVTVDADRVEVVPGLERIVRALAAADPGDYDTHECSLCDGRTWDGTREVDDQPPIQELHDAACPWRLAREWVAANPSFTEMGPTTVTHVVVPGVGAAPLADEPEQQS
jgi:hypothetical protein